MNRSTATRLLRAGVLVVTLVAIALPPSPALADVLRLRDGQRIEGRIIGVDFDAQTFDLAEAPGQNRTVALDRLEPASYVRVVESAVTDNPPRALDLARFALRHEMSDVVRRALERASADPSLAGEITGVRREQAELAGADLVREAIHTTLGPKPASALPIIEKIKAEYPDTQAAALARGVEAVHAARLGVVAPAGGEGTAIKPADDNTWRAALKRLRDAFKGGSVDDRLAALSHASATNRPEFVDAAKTVLEAVQKSLVADNDARVKSDSDIKNFLGRAAHEGWSGRPEQRQEELDVLYEAHDAILSRLADSEQMRSAAVRALAALAADEAVQDLLRTAVNVRTWTVRRDFTEAIGASVTTLDVSRHLDRLAQDGQIPVRLAAIAAAGKRHNDACARLLIALLPHGDLRVRYAAVEACGDSGRAICIGPLIARLSERANEGDVIRLAIDAALMKLTGQTFAGDLALWDRWWTDHRAEVEGGSFAPIPGNGGEGGDSPNTVSFYGIPVDSQRMVFVIDVSGSMQTPAEWHEDNESIVPGQAGPTRLAIAKKELKRAIERLPATAKFNVVFFSSEARVLIKRGALADAEPNIVKQALRDIDVLVAGGGTSAYAALEKAWEIARESWKEPKKEFGADTVFFLTDGQPTDAKPDDIQRAVARWQVDLPMKVHCIDIGHMGEAFLKPLAEANHGRYVAR